MMLQSAIYPAKMGDVLQRVGLLTTAAVGSLIAYSRFGIDHKMPLPPAMQAERKTFVSPRAGGMSYYVDRRATGRPLVLIHSINAAPSAYEMKPLFEHYRGQRPVFALDLPGFGFSERTNRAYTPQLYVDAITDFLTNEVKEPADVIALSLGCEFVAMVALAQPQLINKLTFISPTGFGVARNNTLRDTDKITKAGEKIYKVITFPVWSQAIFDLLTSKPSINYYLGRSFVGETPKDFIDYAYATAHQPGARWAPLSFLGIKLFTWDIAATVYSKLTIPTLMLYDRDADVTFDLLPDLMKVNPAWEPVRVAPTSGLPHWEKLPETTALLERFWGQ